VSDDDRVTSRRSLLIGACLIGTGGIALGGCDHASGREGPDGIVYPGHFRTIALAAALENQAVALYRVLLARIRAGKLGRPAPAFTSFAETCLDQHTEHARTWNGLLRSGHWPAITGVPLAGHAALAGAFSAAATAGQAAVLARRLEDQAAQTYVAVAGSLPPGPSVAAAASIAPVEAMHAAILRFLLGADPVPLSFTGTAAAASERSLTT
jgi:hypothetical protein